MPKLNAKRDEIFAEVELHILGVAPDSKNDQDDDVTIEMLEVHRRLLGHVDTSISFLKAERFTVAEDGPEYEQAEKHRDTFANLWRYLGISETPKFHLGWAHAIATFKRTRGFAEMGEDAVGRRQRGVLQAWPT